MKPTRDHNPRRLDMALFCEHDGALDGHWPVAEFERLLDGAVPDAQAPAVAWQARGRTERRLGADPTRQLHLRVQATVWRQCQRCLLPVALELDVDRDFVFAPNEEAAAKLDEDSEDEDVLVLSRQFDLQALVEDELLLALPIVPMHPVCPVAVKLSDDTAGNEPVAAPKPFAALAALKKKH